MARHISWSPESEDDLSIIINYLILEWNVEVASKFLKDTEYHVSIISKRPKLYPIIYKKQGLRRCVISKQNSLIYSYTADTVDILRVFDTRQNPNKLKFEQQ